MDKYIKGKGILVGTFNEVQIAKGIDKKMVKEYKEKYNLDYVNTELVKRNGKNVGIKIYVCNLQDLKF